MWSPIFLKHLVTYQVGPTGAHDTSYALDQIVMETGRLADTAASFRSIASWGHVSLVDHGECPTRKQYKRTRKYVPTTQPPHPTNSLQPTPNRRLSFSPQAKKATLYFISPHPSP